MLLDAAPTDLKVTADSSHLRALRAEFPDYEQLVAEARAAQEAEHEMTIVQAIRKYPKAIFFSFIISLSIVMEGYDLALLNPLFGQEQFEQRYGQQAANGEWIITAPWQAGLQNGVQVGSIIGLILGGYVSDKLGYRWTMIGSLFLMVAFIFLPVLATNIETILAGQILLGLPLGAYQSMAAAYASEVAPAALRHAVVAYVNLCWVMGQLLASGVLRATLEWETQWAYKLPFALQWIWPVPIAIGCFFATDSPWWQVRHGKLDDARRTLHRLNHRATDDEITAQLALMMHTNAMEKAVSEGTQYWDCFKGVDRRRTEVAAGTWLTQNISGSAFIGWSTNVLQRAGLPASMAFTMAIIQYAIGALGTISSWFTMSYFGRRTLYLGGLLTQTLLMAVIGIAGFWSNENTSAAWAVGILLLIFAVVYQASVGPVCYVIVAEASSTRLRAKTIVIARIVYNLAGIIINIIMPYFLGPEELNWGGRTGLFWAGSAFLCCIWVYFRQPEMKGRTYGELDALFAQKVSARKFKHTVVDQFHGYGSSENVVGETEAGGDTVIDNTIEKKTAASEQQWVETKLPRGAA